MGLGDATMNVALMLESDGPGGAETMLLVLAEELRSLGHGVIPVGPRHGEGWLAHEFRARGFQPETFHLRAAVDPMGALSLTRRLRARRVDVIHSHEFTMAVYGALAARLLRLPHVITMHGSTYFADARRRRTALRWAMRQAHATVGISQDTARRMEDLLDLPGDAVRVVPNGRRLTQGDGSRVRAEMGLPDEALLVVCIGSLYPVKGHAYLIQALAELIRSGRDRGATLAIAGREGGSKASIESLISTLGLEDRVRLLGHRADVADLLDAADVFAMPSLSEGLPLALLEAMASGSAILASGVGGIPEAVRHETDGLLVPAGDAAALASGLSRLLADPTLGSELGRNARERAREAFSPEAMATAYVTLYQGGTMSPSPASEDGG